MFYLWKKKTWLIHTGTLYAHWVLSCFFSIFIAMLHADIALWLCQAWGQAFSRREQPRGTLFFYFNTIVKESLVCTCTQCSRRGLVREYCTLPKRRSVYICKMCYFPHKQKISCKTLQTWFGLHAGRTGICTHSFSTLLFN